MTMYKPVIGRTTDVVIIAEDDIEVPAKVDTGADTSSIWASNLFIDENKSLSFNLFAEGSQYYTGKRHTTHEYEVTAVRSAQGAVQIRYKVFLSIRIQEKRIRAAFTLADRSRNSYPILIGRRLLNGKFIVDVSIANHPSIKKSNTAELNDELQADPIKFFKKYHLDNERGDINL